MLSVQDFAFAKPSHAQCFWLRPMKSFQLRYSITHTTFENVFVCESDRCTLQRTFSMEEAAHTSDWFSWKYCTSEITPRTVQLSQTSEHLIFSTLHNAHAIILLNCFLFFETINAPALHTPRNTLITSLSCPWSYSEARWRSQPAGQLVIQLQQTVWFKHTTKFI